MERKELDGLKGFPTMERKEFDSFFPSRQWIR
jgi:hypothetical protein